MHVPGLGIHRLPIDFKAAISAKQLVIFFLDLTAAERAYLFALFFVHGYPIVNLLENMTMLAPRAVNGRTPQKVIPEKYDKIAAMAVCDPAHASREFKRFVKYFRIKRHLHSILNSRFLPGRAKLAVIGVHRVLGDVGKL